MARIDLSETTVGTKSSIRRHERGGRRFHKPDVVLDMWTRDGDAQEYEMTPATARIIARGLMENAKIAEARPRKAPK